MAPDPLTTSTNHSAEPKHRRLLAAWLHWKRKRFWIITLPVGFVAAMIGTLVVITQITELERHELKIGDWSIAEIDGWHVPTFKTHYRLVRVGPVAR